MLTPEEFVAAGDMLVLRCPTWQWQGGDPTKARSFLPPDKQFLLTRHVPCQRRACHLALGVDDESTIAAGDGDEEDWIATHASHASKVLADEDAPDMDAAPSAAVEAAAEQLSKLAVAPTAAPPPPMPELPSLPPPPSALDDCEEFEEFEEEDPSALAPTTSTAGDGADGILRTRTYDVSISYDKCAPAQRAPQPSSLPRFWTRQPHTVARPPHRSCSCAAAVAGTTSAPASGCTGTQKTGSP